MTRLPTAMSACRTHVRRMRLAIAVGLAALVAAVVWFLVEASALVGFGFAVTAAVAWCVWLERQPSWVRLTPPIKALLRPRTARGVFSWEFHPW